MAKDHELKFHLGGYLNETIKASKKNHPEETHGCQPGQCPA